MREWLKNLRVNELKLNQAQMGNRLCMSRQNYCFLENGQRQKDLDFSLACKISDLCGISLDDIRKFEEERTECCYG